MNKLLAILVIISIMAFFVNCQQGDPVQCGTAVPGGIATCAGCGANATVQGLFTGDPGASTCHVTNCLLVPGSNLNGWMCKSCAYANAVNQVYINGAYFQINTCVEECSDGFTLDSNNNCQLPAIAGNSVNCGTAVTGNAATCAGCGVNSSIQGLFQGDSGATTCHVIDCRLDPGASLNGWMCKSCNGKASAHSAYTPGVFFQTNACVSSCTGGTTADSNNNCQLPAIVGNSVNCGTAVTGNAATCAGCGANSTIQGLFTGDSSATTCHVVDCRLDPGSNLNGWMCKSCNGKASAHSDYTPGAFFQTNACVSACSGGAIADSNNICQPPIPGSSVNCGTAVTSNAATCTGCGANSTIQGLFSGDLGAATCHVVDCKLDPGANLNGWMCKSCNGKASSHSAYTPGAFFQTNACVSACSGGATADSNNICQPPIPIPGSSVNCGTAVTGNAATCAGCGANSTIQGLFTGDSSATTCHVVDCRLDPGSNLNGWMCKSCYGQTSANSAYSAGKLLSGSTCVASCSPGQTADSNNICQVSSSTSFLTLALSVFLLCLFF